MANAKRGMCDLSVGGRTLRLLFDFNAICELEDALHEPFSDCAVRWQQNKFTMKEVRAMVWAGLREHHPEYSIKDCGALIQEIGIEKLSGQLVEAFTQSFPGRESAEGDEGATEGNEGADVGTGTNSSRPPAPTA